MSRDTNIFRRARRKLCVVLLVSLTSTSAIAKQQPQTPVAENRLPEAEKLADRFVQRFAETLDFGVVYKEFFVSNRKQRLYDAVRLAGRASKQNRLDETAPELMEQYYVAFMNFYFLNGLYGMNVCSVDENDPKACKEEYPLPPDALTVVSNSRYFGLLLRDDCCGDGEEDFRTVDDLKEYIADANKINGILRQHIPEKPFDSQLYRDNIREMVYYGKKTSVLTYADEDLGIELGVKRYQVVREIFALNIIEEKGEMKVLEIVIGN